MAFGKNQERAIHRLHDVQLGTVDIVAVKQQLRWVILLTIGHDREHVLRALVGGFAGCKLCHHLRDAVQAKPSPLPASMSSGWRPSARGSASTHRGFGALLSLIP
ncbi:hypothetical protein JH262_02840 [Xanthomonas campestris pv. incanae]|uniref:hypothetical protein n=1 Tax=Xanthomonas campestris TaxID=339 RepID=UPI00236841C9|nr:hypothetical protein [Xanthomonas campestris]WDJ98636.1 hypothetical protein JH262_02840 [Xanthomonas campestris pv. incanae]